MVPAQLHALAGVLQTAADAGDRTGAAVPDAPVPGPVGAAYQPFGETLRAAAGALAGELRWLASAISGAAESWLALDAAVVPRRDAAVPE